MCYADIKPANLLLKYRYPDVDPTRGGCCDASPSIRVIDFGCSQMVEEGSKLAKRTGAHCFLTGTLSNLLVIASALDCRRQQSDSSACQHR